MANAIIPGCGFHHVAMKVRDFDAVRRFYVDGLGCTESLAWGDGDGSAAMLDFGDGRCMEIFAGGAEAGGEGSLLHLCLSTDDADTAYARALAAGAASQMEPTDVDIEARSETRPVRIAFVVGPAGETIEFFQER